MMDIESIVQKNISYLHARDPSILSWNRHRLDDVRVNLADALLGDSSKTNGKEDNQSYIRVFLRLKDGMLDEDLYQIHGDSLFCKVPEGSHALRHIKEGETMTKTYSFTQIFGPETKQIELFNNILKPKMLDFINGKSSTLMTYGASGSGKTFTIVGTSDEPGLIPRALEYVFRTIPKLKEIPKVMPLASGDVRDLNEHVLGLEKKQKSTILNATQIDRSIHIKTYNQMQQRLSAESVAELDDISKIHVSIWVSFAEIYNENIYDLLKPTPIRSQQRPRLKLGNSNGCCYIKDLTSVSVNSGLEAYQVLQYGLHNLNYAATSINSHSSRSHCIFTLRLVQLSELEEGACVSTFNFCDLAGSERVKKTMNVGKRLRESNNINTSLLVLGRCISSIRTAQQLRDNRLIPFRESKLTQLFQKAFTGSEDISMIVNMNPSKDMFDETQHVLNFSAVAKEIQIQEPEKVKKPKKNRFSQYMEKKSLSVPTIAVHLEEDERDIEINKLKNIITDLYTEIEQKRLEYNQELHEEREYLRSEYKSFIKDLTERFEERKALAIEKVKREYEERIQMMRDRSSSEDSDVVILDSSCEDDDEQQQKLKEEVKSLEKLIIDRENRIDLLMQELKVQEQKMITETTRLSEEIKRYREEQYELKVMLDAAEKAYLDLQSELDEATAKNKKSTSEKLQLQERVEQLEEMLTNSTAGSNESE